MKILADQNMPLVDALFSPLGDVERFDGRTLTAAQAQHADVLLTRSVTRVNEQLLESNTQLSFVGTATIGIDHIDQGYLQSRSIPLPMPRLQCHCGGRIRAKCHAGVSAATTVFAIHQEGGYCGGRQYWPMLSR